MKACDACARRGAARVWTGTGADWDLGLGLMYWLIYCMLGPDACQAFKQALIDDFAGFRTVLASMAALRTPIKLTALS